MIVTTPGAGETTIMFHDEPWTVEVARLLLEVDEGWVGYRHDTTWTWHEETYKVFAAICCDRKWPYNSRAACVAMLQAIRTGTISMRLSNATRSSDGYAQWSLTEMRELGTQMRRVVDDESPTVCWSTQLKVIIQMMVTKDTKYTIDNRTAEDFAARAGKYVPERTLLLIDPELAYQHGKTTTMNQTRDARRNSSAEPERRTRWATCRNVTSEHEQRTRRTTQGQAMEDAVDSADEPLVPHRNIRTITAPMVRKRGWKRSAEAYEDEVLWGNNTSLQPEENGVSATQELPSQGELPPLQVEGGGQPTVSSRHAAGIGRPSLPLDTTNQRRPPSAVDHKHATGYQDPPSPIQAPPRQESAPMRESSSQTEWTQQETSPRQYIADQARSVNGTQNDVAAMQQPTRKYRRVQQSSINDRMTVNGRTSNAKADAPSLFRSLNPYDRPGKLWGEFVVEVLLAERTASNEDELDYVQFIRGLYEI